MGFVEFLESNWSVVAAAPWVFVMFAVICGGGGMLAGRFWLSERVTNLESRIARRDDEIAALKENSTTQGAQEDIDAVRQRGSVVGKAVGVIPDFSSGVFLFERIEGNGDFNPKEAFSYRGLSLKIERVMHTAEGNFGALRTQVFEKVTANNA